MQILVIVLLAVAAYTAYQLYMSTETQPPATETTDSGSTGDSKASDPEGTSALKDGTASPMTPPSSPKQSGSASLSDLKWQKVWPDKTLKDIESMNNKKIYLRSSGEFNNGNKYSYLGTKGDALKMFSGISNATAFFVKSCPKHLSEDNEGKNKIFPRFMLTTNDTSGKGFVRCEMASWMQCYVNGEDNVDLGCMRKPGAMISEQLFLAINDKNGFRILNQKAWATNAGNCRKGSCDIGLGNGTVNINGNAGVNSFMWEFAIVP